MISFRCEGCGKAYTVPDDWAGRKSRCKTCGATQPVPGAANVLRSVAVHPTFETPSRRARKKRKKPRTPGREGWISLAIGAGIAAVALALPPIVFVLFTLITVIHELGHTATAWLLASPAVPSFDLTYGGGHSLILARQPLLVALGCVVLAAAVFQARDDRPRPIRWGIAALLYGVAVFTPIRGPLITSMGYGSELIFAGIFLYRALSGNQVLRAEERPLYAALSFFLIIFDARFALSLMRSETYREEYGDAKGGGHQMDFDRIAADLGFSLPTVAGFFLCACALTPVVTFVGWRYRWIGQGLNRASNGAGSNSV